MAEVSTLTFRDWSEFKRDLIPELFGPEPFRPGRYLFRGCGDADWTLTSLFDRRFRHLEPGRRLALWKSLVGSFRATCTDYGVSKHIVSNDHALLAFGQHYGLPTRMLDWSLSPYVASFFALRNALTQPEGGFHQVAVWALDTSSHAWSSEMGVEVLAPPTLDNVRLRNQSGRFTLSRTPHNSLEDHVRHCEVPGKPLIKMLLPASEASYALPDLEVMGVSAAHLFPDFTGLTEAVLLREELATLGGG
jgi:FRG domain